MKNDLTRLLGIEYPIIQGGMMFISGAGLVAAVSEAGGLGTLGQRLDIDNWREQISDTKKLTSKPFAVNLPMHISDIEKRIDIIVDESVPVVITAAGNPAPVVEPLKKSGAKVMHVVASVAQAEKVASLGVDAIIAEGGESGGMVARERVSTMVLIPGVADAVDVPVVAAGGIVDARGLIAAMALGAQGVQIGTRFLASKECDAGKEWKEAIVRAKETDTHVVPRGSAQGRMLKEEVHPDAMAGMAAGLIRRIESAGKIVDSIAGGAEPVLKKIEEQVRGKGG